MATSFAISKLEEQLMNLNYLPVGKNVGLLAVELEAVVLLAVELLAVVLLVVELLAVVLFWG